MRHASRFHRRAFTLVELLVVVSIITLLLAVLIPALQRAREQAKAAACAGTLRGLGAAMQTYASDNDDYIVPALYTDTSSNYYEGWCTILVNGGYVSTKQPPSASGTNPPIFFSNNPFMCPSVEPTLSPFVPTSNPGTPVSRYDFWGMAPTRWNSTAGGAEYTLYKTGRAYIDVGYGINTCSNGESATAPFGYFPRSYNIVYRQVMPKMSSLDAPFRTVFLFDGVKWHNGNSYRISGRHSNIKTDGRTNILAFDSHVENYNRADVFTNETSGADMPDASAIWDPTNTLCKRLINSAGLKWRNDQR